MPISKIENRDEAAKAFMEGAYFKVGDQFISPDEIVTAQKNEDGVPVFKLTTGEKVKHNEFQRGSVGHFLYEQLRKVEGRYVETIKPGFNRYVLASTSKLYDESFFPIRTYSINPVYANPQIAVYEATLNQVKREDYSGGNVTSNGNVTPGTDEALQDIALDLEGNRVFAFSIRGFQNAVIWELPLDLSSETQILGPTSFTDAVNGETDPGWLTIDPNAGVGFALGDETNIDKFNLDGSGSINNLNTYSDGEGPLEVSSEEGVIYHASQKNQNLYKFDYNGNVITQKNMGFNPLDIEVSDENNEIHVAKDGGDFDVFDRSLTRIKTVTFAQTSRFGLFLDLSAL